MTRLQLAKLIWKVGYDGAKKVDPKAPLRDWQQHGKHIVAGFLAIADWHKEEMRRTKK